MNNKSVEERMIDELGGDARRVARRLYGSSLTPSSRRELDKSLAEWGGLGSSDRTFVLAHLGMLQLEVLGRVAEVLEDVVLALEEGGDRASAGDGGELGDLGEEDEVTEEVEGPVDVAS